MSSPKAATRRQWTPQETELLQKIFSDPLNKMGLNDIAVYFSRSQKSIERKKEKMQLGSSRQLGRKQKPHLHYPKKALGASISLPSLDPLETYCNPQGIPQNQTPIIPLKPNVNPSSHTHKTMTPNIWKDRPYKTIIRERLAFEALSLPCPEDLAMLTLPGNTMEDILAMEEKRVPITRFIGIEQDKKQFDMLKECLETQPKHLQDRCLIKKGVINEALTTDVDPLLREKGLISQGLDIIYLDFMCGFRDRTKATLALLGANSQLFQRAHDKGNPGLLYLTWSTRGSFQKVEDTECLTRQRKKHPESSKFGEPHTPLNINYILGVEEILRSCFAMENYQIEPTHRVIYHDQTCQNPTTMIAMGIKIHMKGEPAPAKPGPKIVYLGIEKYENNTDSLQTLIEWEAQGVFKESAFPGRHEFQSTVHELGAHGTTPELIAAAFGRAGKPVDVEVIRSILKQKRTPESLSKPETKPLPNPEANPLPSPHVLAKTTLRCLAHFPMTAKTLEDNICLIHQIPPNIREEENGAGGRVRNHIAHAKSMLVRGGYLERTQPTKPHLLTKKGEKLAQKIEANPNLNLDTASLRKGIL